ncbi:MAG: MarR family winged helix-turn-helix transcriptional regulator [Pseudomonadota bacterium]|nr:MarR family winged helix-turn-helix transcriptional regulator [Pseudomonadota bacterium]
MSNLENPLSDGDGEYFPVAQLLSNAANARFRSALRTYPSLIGLKVVETRTLHEIGLHGPVMARDIANSTFLHEAQVSLAVKKLVGKKLVRFMRDTVDQRCKLLILTPPGMRKYIAVANIFELRRQQILKGMSRKEQAQFFKLLKKITDNAEAMLTADDQEVQLPNGERRLAG